MPRKQTRAPARAPRTNGAPDLIRGPLGRRAGADARDPAASPPLVSAEGGSRAAVWVLDQVQDTRLLFCARPVPSKQTRAPDLIRGPFDRRAGAGARDPTGHPPPLVFRARREPRGRPGPGSSPGHEASVWRPARAPANRRVPRPVPREQTVPRRVPRKQTRAPDLIRGPFDRRGGADARNPAAPPLLVFRVSGKRHGRPGPGSSPGHEASILRPARAPQTDACPGACPRKQTVPRKQPRAPDLIRGPFDRRSGAGARDPAAPPPLAFRARRERHGRPGPGSSPGHEASVWRPARAPQANACPGACPANNRVPRT